jgi:predicted transcriptional regulator
MSKEAAEQRVETKEEKQRRDDIALLQAMSSAPGASLTELATTAKLDRSWVQRALKRLELSRNGKLVVNTLGDWNLTKAGRKAIANV